MLAPLISLLAVCGCGTALLVAARWTQGAAGSLRRVEHERMRALVDHAADLGAAGAELRDALARRSAHDGRGAVAPVGSDRPPAGGR